MWKTIIDMIAKALDKFISGLKFVVQVTVGTKDEVDKKIEVEKDDKQEETEKKEDAK